MRNTRQVPIPISTSRLSADMRITKRPMNGLESATSGPVRRLREAAWDGFLGDGSGRQVDEAYDPQLKSSQEVLYTSLGVNPRAVSSPGTTYASLTTLKHSAGVRTAGRTPLLVSRCLLPMLAGCEGIVHAEVALEYGTVAFSIFAQVSRIETVRLKTNLVGEVSGSTQK